MMIFLLVECWLAAGSVWTLRASDTGANVSWGIEARSTEPKEERVRICCSRTHAWDGEGALLRA